MSQTVNFKSGWVFTLNLCSHSCQVTHHIRRTLIGLASTQVFRMQRMSTSLITVVSIADVVSGSRLTFSTLNGLRLAPSVTIDHAGRNGAWSIVTDRREAARGRH